MKRDRVISVRLSEEEYAALRARGRVSDVVRGILTRRPQPLPTGQSVGTVAAMWWGEHWTGQTYPRVTTQ